MRKCFEILVPLQTHKIVKNFDFVEGHIRFLTTTRQKIIYWNRQTSKSYSSLWPSEVGRTPEVRKTSAAGAAAEAAAAEDGNKSIFPETILPLFPFAYRIRLTKMLCFFLSANQGLTNCVT